MADSSNGATPEVLRWIASVVTMCAGLVLAARARARLIGWAFVVLVRLSDLDCDRVRQRRIRADGAEHRPDAHQPLWNLPLADLERKDLAGNANSPVIRRSGAFGCLDGGALLVHLDGNEPRLF